MASKIDFNILLAKADKNANDARRLLEEKKRLTQQQQKPSSSTKQQPSKQSAIAFIEQKKEEIRKRNEEEARQLLLKKQQRDALQNQQLAKKKPPSTNAVSKDAVQKYLNSKNNPNGNSAVSANSLITNDRKPSSGSVVKKNITSKPAVNRPKSTSATLIASSKAPTSSSSTAKSYYDTIPTQSAAAKPVINKLKAAPAVAKPPIKTNAINPVKNSIPKKIAPSSGAPKQVLSYDQMLKMAENCHKDKVINKVEVVKSEIAPSKHTDLYYSTSSKTTVKKTVEALNAPSKRTEISDSKQQQPRQFKHVEGGVKPTANIPKASVSAVQSTNGGVSSWDRIVADMKKKNVKKNKKLPENLPDIDYDEEEEDEYDSEMDDFIDDEEYDDNGSGDGLKHKKDYSKTIQEIFKYDPKRYKNIKEDDLDDMETNFHSLLKEERMSLKLAIREDLEEQKREEEREKQRLEKLKKRQLEDAKNSDIKKLKTGKT